MLKQALQADLARVLESRSEIDHIAATHLDKLARTNIQLAPKPIDFDSEGAARLALLRKCPHGSLQLADPDGTLIDVAEDHH